MSVVHALCIALLATAGQAGGKTGAIGGVVLDRHRQPVPGAEVVLRVSFGGSFVPRSQTTAGSDGRFLFQGLEVGPSVVYLPGANRQGIHYPDRRIRLTEYDPVAFVELEVCDALTGDSPLVARRHEIVIRAGPGQLRVREVILIDNPSSATYVGPTPEDGQQAVTFQLSIPSDFERVTFDQEFFGRRFSIAGGRLVTAIPWTPGTRQLGFTYVLRNEQRHRVWQRPLDLPTSNLEVRVETGEPDQVSCNLPRQGSGEDGCVVFASAGRSFPAGYAVHVELGQLPLPFYAYARWLAALVLTAVAAAAVLVVGRTRRAAKRSGRRTATGDTARTPPVGVPRPPRRKGRKKKARLSSATRSG